MRLREHHVKPATKFYGENEPYHLGIELEIEAPNQPACKNGLEICKRPHVFYAKKDGSLNSFGWELITHPIGKNLWQTPNPKPANPCFKFFKMVSDLRSLDYNSHNGGRCGLHVHVDKKAFGPKGSASCHYYWFYKLVNENLFRKISQRTDDSLTRWTKQEKKSVKATKEQNYSRYMACNQTNHTVEVRLFRGNMREDRIRKSVEAVIAAVEFTRTLTSRDWKENINTLFALYVSKNKNAYPNLFNYLKEINVIAMAEDKQESEIVQCA